MKDSKKNNNFVIEIQSNDYININLNSWTRKLIQEMNTKNSKSKKINLGNKSITWNEKDNTLHFSKGDFTSDDIENAVTKIMRGDNGVNRAIKRLQDK